MHIDTEQFRRDGYLIIREAVPPEHLGNLRISSELMVDEMKRLSRRARQPEDPYGGSWSAQPQPRVEVERVVTEETANLVDFYLGESVLGVASEYARNHGMNPIVLEQSGYSMLTRSSELDRIPCCLDYGISFMPYRALQSGFQ